jgi:hypothetical protein
LTSREPELHAHADDNQPGWLTCVMDRRADAARPREVQRRAEPCKDVQPELREAAEWLLSLQNAQTRYAAGR